MAAVGASYANGDLHRLDRAMRVGRRLGRRSPDPGRPTALERVNVQMVLARGTLVVRQQHSVGHALRHRRLQLAQLPELRDRHAGEHLGQRGLDLELQLAGHGRHRPVDRRASWSAIAGTRTPPTAIRPTTCRSTRRLRPASASAGARSHNDDVRASRAAAAAALAASSHGTDPGAGNDRRRGFAFGRPRCWSCALHLAVLARVARLLRPVCNDSSPWRRPSPFASWLRRRRRLAAPGHRAAARAGTGSQRPGAGAAAPSPARRAPPVAAPSRSRRAPRGRPCRRPAVPPRTDYLASSRLDPGPQLLEDVEPVYPAEAGLTEGSVVLRLLIGKSGTVDEVTVVRSRPQGVFDRSAVAAFSAARFSPGMVLGVPVKSQLTHRGAIHTGRSRRKCLGADLLIAVRPAPGRRPARAAYAGTGIAALRYSSSLDS